MFMEKAENVKDRCRQSAKNRTNLNLLAELQYINGPLDSTDCNNLSVLDRVSVVFIYLPTSVLYSLWGRKVSKYVFISLTVLLSCRKYGHFELSLFMIVFNFMLTHGSVKAD